MSRWSWPIHFNSRKNSRDGRRRRQVKGARGRVFCRLRLEALEDRTLMSGDPYLTLVLASHTILENAGPAATTATVTRNNMDTSQALIVNLKSSDTTQVTVPSNVTIPAGASSVTFNVGAVDNFVVDPTRTVTITAWAPSPIAAGLDATFGTGGYLSVPLQENSSANRPGVKVQADGKILAVASSQMSGATWAISRSLTNGTLDTSFGTNGTAVTTFSSSTGGYANGIAIQPDGKIVVVGTVNTSGPDEWGIARYNTDGSLDSTFGTGGLVVIKFTSESGWLYDAAILSNGNILVGGMRQEAAGFAVARLTSTGAIDTSFGTSGFAGINPDPSHSFFNTTGQAMIVQPDGKILMTGIANFNGIPVARFNANGTADTSFNGSGVQLIPLSAFGSSYTSGVGEDLALQADGKIIVTGHVDPANFNDNWATARLNADGSLDTGFNSTGTAIISFQGGSDIAHDVTVQADGKIIVAGRAAVSGQGYNLALARYNSNGTLDSTFNGNGEIIFPPLPSIFEEIWSINLQADGKLAATVGYNTDMRIARFDTGLLTASDSVSVIDTDGSILIPGSHRDLIYDASRHLLYITSGSSVQRYDTVGLSLLGGFSVGTSLNGADITADDSSLYVAEGATSGSQGIVHKVNLATGAVTNLTYNLAFGEAGAWDVALSSNGKGLVTTMFSGSGWTPLRQLDTSTDTLSIRTDDPGSGPSGEVRQNSLLARGADRSLLSLTESNDSDGRAMTYSAAADSFPVFSDTGMFLDNRLAAISRDGSLVAVEGSALMVADRNFNAVVNLPGIDGGAAFDPIRDVLYGVNSNMGQIMAFDTHTWAVKYVLPVGEKVGSCGAFGNGVMRVSDDGKLLFLATPSGVRMYFLRPSTGVAISLSVAGFPSFVKAGNSATFTVTALDPAGNVATGYTGTVTFASTDGAATLPSTYTFTASDQGVHTFTATLNTAGTQSLTVTDSGNSLTATEGNIVVHVAGASLIPVTTHRDLVFDAQRHILYITTSSGTIQRYDLASGDLLTPFQLIDPLNGGDITATGNALYVADGQRNLIQGFVDKVDLSTGNISRLTYNLSGGGYFEDAAWDLALGPANLGLVTTEFPGSGWTPLRQLDTNTDTFTVRTDDPGSGGGGQVGQNTPVRRGADRSEFILTESNIGSGPFFAYNAVSNTFSKAVDTNTFLDNRASAVNRNGTLLAVDIYNSGVTIYDANLNVVKVLSGVTGGLLFDPLRDLLYVASSGFVDVYDTNTWNVTNSLTIGESVGTFQTFGNGVMSISNDGQWLFVATASGVRILSLPVSTSASTLVVSGFPSPSTAGVAGSFTVTAEDSTGHVVTGYTGTVHFTSSDAQAALPVDYTFVAADAGVHTFSATLKTAGTNQSITATDTVTSTITGSQSGITVNPAAASSLIVAGFPSPTTAGVAGTVTVTANDPYGNTATGYTGTVHFTSSDAQAVLPADYTFTAADAGVHTFNVTLKTAGSQSLTATDTVIGTITGTQTGITVKAAAASTFVVSGFPSSVTAGTSGNVTVTAKDPYGNTAAGYTGSVHFTSSDSQAVLPADYAFVAADAGVHTFSATLKTAAVSQSLTATDTVTSTITGSQTGITVNPAAADHLAFGVQPSNTVAGVAVSPAVSVQILDKFNNLVTTDNSDGVGIAIGTNPNSGTLSGTATVTASGGVATFSNLSINKAGNGYTLTASSGSLGAATSTSFAITPAAASTFNVAGFPSPVVSGQAQNFTVTALDAFGNTATGYGGKVHFTSTDLSAALPTDYTFVTADAGVHRFSATLETAATQSLTATDATTASITGTQTGILVKPASFLVSGFPSPITAGVAHTFSVTAQNANGTTATGYTGTVHFTSSDSQAVLPADYTFTSTDAGVHSFTATLKTAGTRSLTATDSALTSVTGTQSNITVNAAAASVLAVTGFPSPTVAGVVQTFTVTAQDPYGNTVASYRGTVKFSSSDKQASLPAPYTFASTDNGVHSFSATLKTAGSQSLTATDTKTATITGTETGITVNPAAAKTLTVAGFPSPTTAGIAHSFTVTAKDPFGNIATGYAGTVHFTSSDSQAVLPSDYTFVGSDAGVHSFSATLKTAGSRSITAKDTVTATITGAQTGITVNATAASKLMLSPPSSSTAGAAFTLTVTAQDPYGNTATSYTGTVKFTSSDSRATLPANYTFISTDAGKHTFTNGVTLKTAGKQTITATDTVTASITGTATVNVTAAAASMLSLSAPATVTAGTAFTLTVTALDPYGNRATGYRGTVHFTSSDPKAVLPGDYTFTSADNGAHSFNRGATLKTAGTQSITATDTVTSTITGQANIKVNAAAASTLVVTGFPSPIAHGTAASFTVTVEDAYGNIATGYLGTVHFTSSDTKASLPANYKFTAADAGVHTFTATLNTSGTQSITGTDALNSSITGTESGIQVTAASVETLFENGLFDADDAGGMLDLWEAEGRPAAVAVVVADLPENLGRTAGTQNRLAEAIFSRPEYLGDPNQEAGASVGALAALTSAYGLVASKESRRRKVPVDLPNWQP